MKKTLITLGCVMLSACVAHETDLDVQAARRQANIDARHQAVGCTFARDHEAYRNCVMNTYYMQHPRTYMPAELENGQPLAVTYPAYQTGTPVFAPLPEPKVAQWAAPTTIAHTESIETTCEKTYQPQEAVITTTETSVTPPPPEVIVVEQEEAPAPQTWWDNYQDKKKPVAAPKCPCDDPNDPCPQCYDK